MSDPCSREGAAAIATRLRDYWQARGFSVTTHIEHDGYVAKDVCRPIYGVRSNLIGGVPESCDPRTIRLSEIAR